MKNMMKRILSVLVAAVMLVAFTACGKSDGFGFGTTVPTTAYDPVREKEEMIVGEWIFNEDYVVVFNADHSGKIVDGDEMYMQWSYNEARDSYMCTVAGMMEELTYMKNGEEVLLYIAGDVGKRAEPGTADAVASSVLGKDLNGNVCIRSGKLESLTEKVVLTVDNWRNYISVISYESSSVTKNAFGDVIGAQVSTKYMLGATKERYHEFANTSVELKNKVTGEIKIYNFNFGGCEVDSGFNIEDYECTRITGSLYFMDIPEEAIHDGYVLIGDSSFNTGFDVDVDLKVTKRGVEGYVVAPAG